MEALARRHGACISKNITRKTTLLVMGKAPGSKLDRAFERGLKLMVDEEFLQMIEDA